MWVPRFSRISGIPDKALTICFAFLKTFIVTPNRLFEANFRTRECPTFQRLLVFSSALMTSVVRLTYAYAVRPVRIVPALSQDGRFPQSVQGL